MIAKVVDKLNKLKKGDREKKQVFTHAFIKMFSA